MTQHSPRVSVGLAVYNGENFIRAAIDSILAQTFTDFELVISDNASTDKTQEICLEYAAKDGRIRYYRCERNMGAAWNQNRVFELSRGEYFRLAAHDDVIAPEYLAKCVEVLDQNPSVVLCHSWTKAINDQGEVIEDQGMGVSFPSHQSCWVLSNDCSRHCWVMGRCTLIHQNQESVFAVWPAPITTVIKFLSDAFQRP